MDGSSTTMRRVSRSSSGNQHIGQHMKSCFEPEYRLSAVCVLQLAVLDLTPLIVIVTTLRLTSW